MLLASVPLVLMACGAGDDVADGTRAECAHGGALTDCPEAERTPEAACWRLVDCGAIAVKNDKDNNAFDWGLCVDTISGQRDYAERAIVDCIAASSCDQLQVWTAGAPYCFYLGDPQ